MLRFGKFSLEIGGAWRFLFSLYLITVIQFPSPAIAQVDLQVNWSSSAHDGLKLVVSGRDEQARACLDSGFEVRYRFEIELCRKTALWFDSCSATKVFTREVQYDPIGETYNVSVDIHGDKDDPVKQQTVSRDEALEQVSGIKQVPLSLLRGEQEELTLDSKAYVGVRVLSFCKGEFNETMSRISYFLSLGLIRISGFNSGWIRFNLYTPGGVQTR